MHVKCGARTVRLPECVSTSVTIAGFPKQHNLWPDSGSACRNKRSSQVISTWVGTPLHVVGSFFSFFSTLLQNSSIFTKMISCSISACVLYYGGGTRILGMKTSFLPMGTIHTSTLLDPCTGADMQYGLVWWVEIWLFLSLIPWILEI